jgi:hypothetical protein
MVSELLFKSPVELTRREIFLMAGGLPTDSPFHAVDRWLLGDPDTLQPATDILIDGVSLRWDGAWRERFLAVTAIRAAHLSAEERAAAASSLASELVDSGFRPVSRAAARLSHAGMRTFVALVVAAAVFMITGTVYGLIKTLRDELPAFFLWKTALVVLDAVCGLAAAGIVAAFPATLVADTRRNRRWRQLATMTLGDLGGPDAASALASLAAKDSERKNPTLWKAYGIALPTLRESDYGRLHSRATQNVCSTLALTRIEPTDDQMAMEILRALEVAGNGSGADAVKQFAEDPSVDEEPTRAAYRTLGVLEERFRAERQANRLLRSAERPDESSSLMRPAESSDLNISTLPRLPESSGLHDRRHVVQELGHT